MEENKEKNQNQDTSQGKQSTAETNMTYHLDAEDLRNSTTTSMADSDLESDQVAGGDREDDLIAGITDDTEADTDPDR